MDQDREFAAGAPRSETLTPEREGTGAAGVPDAAMRVGSSVRDETTKVADEVKGQASDLVEVASRAVSEQAGIQQQRAAENLHSMSGQFGLMADAADSGVARDLVRGAADRVDVAARWLENNEPGALLEDVKAFARRKPGVFIAIAVGAGILAGRFARSALASSPRAVALERNTADTLPGARYGGAYMSEG